MSGLKALTDQDIFPFGPYRGRRMEKVPAGYLLSVEKQRWLKEKWPAVAEYINRSRTAINWEIEHPGE